MNPNAAEIESLTDKRKKLEIEKECTEKELSTLDNFINAYKQRSCAELLQQESLDTLKGVYDSYSENGRALALKVNEIDREITTINEQLFKLRKVDKSQPESQVKETITLTVLVEPNTATEKQPSISLSLIYRNKPPSFNF